MSNEAQKDNVSHKGMYTKLLFEFVGIQLINLI